MLSTSSVNPIRAKADYQQFVFNDDGLIDKVGRRMDLKLKALDGLLPDFINKSVLDVGCDFGFWSFLASEKGARKVTGIDRGREVKGVGWVDLPDLNNRTAAVYPQHKNCVFRKAEIGKQWLDFGKHDIVFLMSLYHHIFNQCGDHSSIWYWLWRHTGETLIWENPTSNDDSVVQMNVRDNLRPWYTEDVIRACAEEYFDIEKEAPSLHETTRVIWVCKPKKRERAALTGDKIKGAGGASKAFLYNDSNRTKEIEAVLGICPLPGSLNMRLDEPFDWGRDYYRAAIQDVVTRSKGLDSEWAYRAVRFYPVKQGYIMRFEGERYPLNFIELISDKRLSDIITDTVEL